jgi:hypothetical protein
MQSQAQEVLAKVAVKKVDRKNFRAIQKKKQYNKTKKHLENVAFGDGDDG